MYSMLVGFETSCNAPFEDVPTSFRFTHAQHGHPPGRAWSGLFPNHTSEI
jgi:hypothetical protein